MAEKSSVKNQHILKDLIETKDIVSIYIYFKRLNRNIKLISLILSIGHTWLALSQIVTNGIRPNLVIPSSMSLYNTT